MTNNLLVRPYNRADHDAVWDVCVRAAHADRNSRTDPDLETVPLVFAGPYLALEPDLAFVLTHHSNVVALHRRDRRHGGLRRRVPGALAPSGRRRLSAIAAAGEHTGRRPHRDAVRTRVDAGAGA